MYISTDTHTMVPRNGW